MAKDEKQLKQMTRYILNEAKDKAEEIMAETLQEYHEKKTRIFNAGKEKVNMEVEDKRKNELIKMKISGSGAELRNRVAKVNLQHDKMQAIALAAKEKLVSVCEADQKQELLKKFIVQGCLMLLEPEVTVICRAADQEAVSAIKNDAEKEYTDQIQTQINKHSGGSVSVQRTVKLTVQTFSSEFDFYSAGDNCIGGVVLQTGGDNPAVKGKITAPAHKMGKEGTYTVKTKKFMYNALLGRKQMVVEITQQSDRRGTIPKKDIQAKLAAMYKVKDDNCVSVFGFKNAFGGGRMTGFGLIYDSISAAKRVEPKHRLLRLGLIEKKKSNRKQLKERKNKAKKHRGLAKTKGAKKKKD